MEFWSGMAPREPGGACSPPALGKALEYGDAPNVARADERRRLVELEGARLFSEHAWREPPC